VLTRNAGKQLAGKALDLAAGKRHEAVALEEVEDALAEQVGDDADVVAEVEAVAQVDALVAVGAVVGGEGGEDAQLDLGGVAVLLHGADDLDGAAGFALAVVGLDDLAEGALAEEADDGVWSTKILKEEEIQ
jgi:hypothetical protein